MNKWLKNFFQYLDRYYVKYHSLPTLEAAGVRILLSYQSDVICDSQPASQPGSLSACLSVCKNVRTVSVATILSLFRLHSWRNSTFSYHTTLVTPAAMTTVALATLLSPPSTCISLPILSSLAHSYCTTIIPSPPTPHPSVPSPLAASAFQGFSLRCR